VKCHVDGELRPVEQAVSATDRGLLYGDAAVETVRAANGVPFAWDAHRKRLNVSCDALGIAAPTDLRERIVETLDANGLSDALVRVSITRGTTGSAAAGLSPPDESGPTVLVTTEPVEPIAQTGGAPAHLQTVTTRPIPEESIPRKIQSHCRLDRVLARRELVPDADEALLRTREGTIADCAGSALLVVADDAIHVPPLPDGAVPRVMRTVALEIARDEQIPVAVDDLTPSDVRSAAEVLLANARWGVRPVETVDGIEVDPGPVTALLSRLVTDRVATT
jgi:branched-chain amino acid aminotransferase